MRFFIYLRVSTDDQEDNTSLEQQEIDCRAYCELNSHSVAGVFKDVYTGSVWRERKGFMAMRDRYLHGDADAVLVRTYSRFTRMIAHFYVLTEEMKEYGVQLLCVKEAYDNTVIGRMLQGIQMGFNEQERETTRQRMIDGKRGRVTIKKQYLASKHPPYGFKFNDPVKKSKLLINNDRMRIPDELNTEAKVVRWIITQRAAGRAFNPIARELIERGIPAPRGGIWSKRAIQRIIDNCRYLYRGIGVAFQTRDTKEYREGKLVHIRIANDPKDMLFLDDGVVERMVSDKLAFKALEITEAMKQDNPRANSNPEDALLRGGFIKCGLCGHTMVTVKMTRYPVPYYECNGTRAVPKYCVSNTITVPMIDDIVWEYAVEAAKKISMIEEAIKKALGEDTLASAEKSTLRVIAECDAHIAQHQEDLKGNWKPATRAFLLGEMEKQYEIKKSLEMELESIRTGRLDHYRLETEFQSLLEWCNRIRLGENTNPDWKEKRDHLRALGIVAYVYPTKDLDHERYEIRIAPKGILDAINGERLAAPPQKKELSAVHPD